MCAYYLKDSDTAKDLTQNIFLDMWERKVSFKEQVEMEKYLTRCCKYQVLNYFRYTRRMSIMQVEDIPEHMEMNFERPDIQLQYKEMEKRIEAEMEKLSEPSRTVFYMSRREYMSYQQIADEVGISVATVEYHISKCLRRLRQQVL
jgi:RNA polymerase sigma-70 factor (ECF subfamily)